jgi:predicted permease
MPDWAVYIRERLPELPLDPATEREVVEELAAQFASVYATARSAGASHEAACARVDAEVEDWPALGRLLGDTRRARPMSPARALIASSPPSPASAGATRFLSLWARDAQHAVRALRLSPLFAGLTIAILATTIGTVTAVFALLYATVLSPLPYPQAGRLVLVQEVIPEIQDQYPVVGVNARSYLAWADGCRTSCEQLAALGADRPVLAHADLPEVVDGARVTPRFMSMIGGTAQLGRLFVDGDAAGAGNLVVLSDAFWRERFAADPAVVGQSIPVDGVPHEVIGVLAPSVWMPRMSQLAAVKTEGGVPAVLRPLIWNDEQRRSGGEYDYSVLLRLRPAVSADAATAELTALTTAAFVDIPIHPRPVLRPLRAYIIRGHQRPLWMLMLAVIVALLIACLNLSNLLGVRWVGRRRELSVRATLGASAGALARFVAAEALVLACAGGTAGLALAWIAVRMLARMAPPSLPRLGEVTLSPPVIGAAALLSVVCGMLCALSPALQAFRMESHTVTGSRHVSPGRRPRERGMWYVGAETALATALLILGAVLLGSFVEVMRVDGGFQPDHVVAADLTLPPARYPTAPLRSRVLERLLASADALPGVARAALVRRLPLQGDVGVNDIRARDDARQDLHPLTANYLQVSPGYFAVMGIPIVEGRDVTDADRARPTAVISLRTARALWPTRSALGQQITAGVPGRTWVVVGVVGDVKAQGLDAEPPFLAYIPYWDSAASEMTFVLRTTIDPAAQAGAIRRLIAGVDPELATEDVRTMTTVVERSVAPRRFQALLMMAFAALGVVLAALGIYGVTAAAVERRRTELAVRLAVGAPRIDIGILVFRWALLPAGSGAVLGAIAGILASHVLDRTVYGVSASSPGILLAIGGIVALSATAAAIAPAIRAVKTPLASTLRGA